MWGADGGNTSPLLADLTLSVMEFKYLTAPINRPIALQLQYISRYIDDIFSLNYDGFDEVTKEIYDDSLNLEFSALADRKCNYLDINLEITDCFRINVYNKVDSFPFNVQRYSYADSNIPSHIYYSTFSAELLRFARICNTTKAFEERLTELYLIFICRNFSSICLLEVFLKTVTKNDLIFMKFNIFSKVDASCFTGRIFI